MNETQYTFSGFIQKNAFQFLAAAFTIILSLIAAYISYQLFERSTTKSVQALETTVSNQQQIINQLVTTQAVMQSTQTSTNQKVGEIYIDVKDIKDYLLKNR